VDILKGGALDYSDELLAQLDVVVCSIHSYFNLEREAMTERMLAAIENPYAQIIGHPTGRVLLRREAIDYDMEKVLAACGKHGVAMECNSYPDRLDLKDVYLRMCKERGVKVVISTDAHNAGNLSLIRYGVRMARRGWLEKRDVINTLGVGSFWGRCGGGRERRRDRKGKKKGLRRGHRVHREEKGDGEIHRTKYVRWKSVPRPDEAYGAQNPRFAEYAWNEGVLWERRGG